MKIIDVLKKGWCKNYEALTPEGVRVNPHDTAANRRCLIGAIKFLYGLPYNTRSLKEKQCWDAVETIIDPTRNTTIVDWNDCPSRTYEEVLEVAQKLAEQGF